MTTSKPNTQSQTIELSTEAFETFCEDISGMFGVDMECRQLESSTDETVEGLNKRFKELVAVNSIKSEGALDGSFQIVFDREGLFTLAGVILTMPEQDILNKSKQGTAKDADNMRDAIGEGGNLLVGSWDRIFREEFEDHGHFVQTDTFIGNPWDNPKEKIGLADDEEFLFVPYEMTIASYPTFNCGVIFPKKIFGEMPVSDTDTDTVTPEDANSQEKPEKPQDTTEKADSKEPDTTSKNDNEESESQADTNENQTETNDPTAEATDEANPDTEETADPEEPTDAIEPAAGPVSGTIQRMAQSLTGLPGEDSLASLKICAKDIMQKEVLWCNAEDSVQQALTKMQLADVGYMMVGTQGLIEGIVSTFDIAAALSVYLKPMFAKWRRPIDDATLQIKIKWIMTTPVHTINPDTSAAAIIENMRHANLRCLPVEDQQGNIAGLVTAFDIFKVLLDADPDISTAGLNPQAPSAA